MGRSRAVSRALILFLHIGIFSTDLGIAGIEYLVYIVLIDEVDSRVKVIDIARISMQGVVLTSHQQEPLILDIV